MSPTFHIRDWSAFAVGLEDRASWSEWARAPWLPTGAAAPTLSELPPMQRRRVEKLGRLALQVAYWCQSAEQAGWPLVFASRHGDLARTYAMLQELARGEPLSPTHFGLSTHNAIAAQYSIARGLPANYLAVSAGACCAEAAVVEAQGLLADGADDVLVVNYDSPVPEDYAVFADEPACDFAWAWRLSRAPEAGAPAFSLTALEQAPQGAGAGAQLLPHGLDVLRFMLSGDPALDYADADRAWRWQRHA